MNVDRGFGNRIAPCPRFAARHPACELAKVIAGPDLWVIAEQMRLGIGAQHLHRIAETGVDIHHKTGSPGSTQKLKRKLVNSVYGVSMNDPKSALGEVHFIGDSSFYKKVSKLKASSALPSVVLSHAGKTYFQWDVNGTPAYNTNQIHWVTHKDRVGVEPNEIIES